MFISKIIVSCQDALAYFFSQQLISTMRFMAHKGAGSNRAEIEAAVQEVDRAVLEIDSAAREIDGAVREIEQIETDTAGLYTSENVITDEGVPPGQVC